jgi:signal transduction protein with GAF and PtsI domain
VIQNSSTALEYKGKGRYWYGSVRFRIAHPAGKEEPVKRMGQAVSGSAELREEYEESRKRLGISEEKVWVQRTPIGQAMIVYWETEDPQRTLRQLADSQDEVDNKFRQMVKNAALAIDLSKENPLSYELLFEWQQP